ncbi:MAG: Gfo/Idh/MocA family oxidoreductase [Paludibaculum sp.]
MKEFRTGLVGCGLFGESHLSALQAVPGVRVAAVFDLDPVRAQVLAGRYQVPKVAGSLAELLDAGVDVVHVATPEHCHREPVVAALQAGKDVLVEKPFATSLDDCAAMAAEAQASGRTLMVGHLLRFDPRYAVLREEAAAGRIGRIVAMSARRGRMRGGFHMYERTHPALCNCVHDIDILLSLDRSPVVRVRGFERKIHSTLNPDWVMGILEFASGAIGRVETNWLLPDAAGIGLDDGLQVTGELGSLSLSLQPAGLSVWSEGGYSAPDAGYETRMYGAAHGALLNELLYFYRCLAAGRPVSAITLGEATNTMRTALALVESAQTGRDVELQCWSPVG